MSERSHKLASIAVEHDPFAGGELLRVVPSTEPQREVWLADQLGEDASLAYNESCALQLRGALDVGALATAVQALVDRHDALRGSFGPDGETLCIGASLSIELPVVDLSQLDEAARDDALLAHDAAAVGTPFDLQHGPLFRATLLRLDRDAHRLILSAHHVVCDGWSWWLMVGELASLYAPALSNTGAGKASADALPPAPSFADYALDQAIRGDDQQSIDDARYWRERFANDVPVLDLPLDRARPSRRTFASAREDVCIDAALVGDVRRLGARRGASLFATLLGAFATVLSRLAGQSSVVVGIPAAGQSVDGHDSLVGHCVNLLPLRFDIDPQQSVGQLVDAAQLTLLDAIEHQRHTFGTLLKSLRVDRDPSRLPLVSVMFNIDQALDRDASRFPGVAATFDSIPRQYENFELFVNAVQRDGGLVLECQYNTGLFNAASIRRWMRGFETLLREAVRGADARVADLGMLAAEDREALLALQPPATPFDRHCAMHALFEHQANATPDRIALRHGDDAWTYAQLDARANRIAALLRGQGAHAGTLVGLALDRGPDMLAGLLGILKTGAGYVPLDPAFPPDRLAYMVGDAGLAALVTQVAHAVHFDLRGRPVLVLDAMDDVLDAASTDLVDVAIDPESVAYVIYTSGSTGKPKGVQVPHRAVANFITAMQARPRIAADDRLVAVTTLSFDIAVLELLLPLSVGAEVILADRDTAMDGTALAQLIQRHDATLMQATPATWRMLVDAGWRGHDRFTALCGGEPLPPVLAQALLDRSGAVWNLYGPTETTVWSTCWRVASPERGVSIGTPIANTTVWVLDAQGQPCAIGVPGELWIGGDGVTLGYLGRAEMTADRFVVDPFANGDAHAKLYGTGDRGRWRDDGTLEHLGRLDFQVKVRGYRIELGEIETALVQQPAIAQAVVLVREDRPGDVRIVAYTVPADAAADSATGYLGVASGHVLDERAVVDALRGTLPDYMLPQHVVVLHALPLLPNGKIDRNGLPTPDPAIRSQAVTAPRSDTERAVAAAMSQVLGMPEIDIHDNFFALGGHSLLAAQLTSRLNRELGLGLTLRALFDGPTVAQLAALAADAEAAPPRQPIPRRADQSRAPLSLMQERLWMLAQFAPGQLTYNTPSGHRLVGPLDVEAFARAFDAVLQRQSVLRTSIVEVDGEVVQVVHDCIDSGLRDVVDLSGLPAEAREAAAIADIDRLVHIPLHMHDAPMFCARLYRLDAHTHALFFMPHHAIWDGWSFDLLYEELAIAYAACERGDDPQREPLPVSYGDYAAWHRDFVEGPDYARQLDFWRGHLGNADGARSPLLALPTDHPRTHGMSGEARALPVALPRALVDRLHGVALSLDATLFVTLLAAYYALIASAAGQRDVIIATPVRGRDREETESLMGYFTILLPLRLAVDPAQPFAALVARVKSVVLDAFAHPEVRLEDLMRELSVRTADGSTVLYHALFSFQDIRKRPTTWGSIRHERIETATPGATEDLGLWFVESDHGLSGGMNYNVALFENATAERLWQRYVAILESIAGNPSQLVEGLLHSDDGRPARIGSAPGALAPAAAPAAKMVVPNGGRIVTQPMSTAAPELADRAIRNDTPDPLQAHVMTAWCDVLGVDSAGLDDDFFAVGGHSLAAVQLFHRLARATGVNLPLATLLSASTVRELAAAYADAGAELPQIAAQAVVVAAPRDPWRPLVLMRAGGDVPPLFFIHAVGGNVLNYRPLAIQMPEGTPVYGLQAFGLNGISSPLRRIEDMASRYIEEIRSVQPHGPYQLAGGSMGGMIAYEIAQQLQAHGEQVGLLGLIDTSSSYGRRLREQVDVQPSRWKQLRERVAGRSPLEATRIIAARLRVRTDKARAQRRIAALRARGEELPHELRYADIESAHFCAYRDYVVRPYPGALTLFRAEQQRGSSVDGSLDWSDMVGALQIVAVPGNHDNIVEAPELARALRACLEIAGRCYNSRIETPNECPVTDATLPGRQPEARPPNLSA